MNDETPVSYNKEDRQLGMICHLIALIGVIIPFGTVLGPLVFWQVKKAGNPFVDEQGKESLNFQLNALVVAIVLGILMIVPGIGGIFRLLVIVTILGALGFAVFAAVKINEGQNWRYPLPILRLIQ